MPRAYSGQSWLVPRRLTELFKVATCSVQKHRWAILGTGFLFIVVLLMFGVGAEGGDTGPGLMFVGYTNELLTPDTQMPVMPRRDAYIVVTGDSLEGPERFTVPTALLLATNTGSVAVEVFAAVSPGSFTARDFAGPSTTGLPRVLKQGQSTIIKVVVDPRQGPWWTEVAYQPRRLRDRLYGWAWNSGNATVKAWVAPKLPGIAFVKFGPVTNQPASGYKTFPIRWHAPTMTNRPLEDLMF
jgi:hypothetical protein